MEEFRAAVTTEEAEAADIPGAAARITREEAEAAPLIRKQPIQQEGYGDANGSVRIFGVKEPALTPQYLILDQNWLPTEDAKNGQALGRVIGLRPRWKSTKP